MPRGVYLHKKGYKQSQQSIEKRSKANRGKRRTSDTCRRISESLMGKRLSSEHRKHISDSQLGKSLSMTHRDSIGDSLVGNKNALGYHHTEDAKRRIGVSSSNPSDSLRNARSLAGVKSVALRVPNRYRGNPSYYLSNSGKRYWLRSSYEVRFAKWLDKQLLTWTYQPKAFLDADGIHRVLPDFYVQEWGSYVEIKPWAYREEAYEMKRILECLHSEVCLIVMDKELKDLEEGKWVH